MITDHAPLPSLSLHSHSLSLSLSLSLFLSLSVSLSLSLLFVPFSLFDLYSSIGIRLLVVKPTTFFHKREVIRTPFRTNSCCILSIICAVCTYFLIFFIPSSSTLLSFSPFSLQSLLPLIIFDSILCLKSTWRAFWKRKRTLASVVDGRNDILSSTILC